MRTIASGLATALLAAACGGGAAGQRPDDDDVDFSPETSNLFGEVPTGEVPDETLADDGPAAPTGPTQVTVEVRLGSEDFARGQVVIQNEAGATVTQGRAGQTFTLPAGEYTVLARATSENDIIGAPIEGSASLTVAGQREHTVRVSIPAAQVRLNVMRNGRPLRNPQVTLFRDGGEERVARFTATDRHITIVPGRYEAEVRVGNQEIRVRGLTFMEGALQTIPVNVR
jgi:hypothetical protein